MIPDRDQSHMSGQPCPTRIASVNSWGIGLLKYGLHRGGEVMRNSTQFYKTTVVMWITLSMASVVLAAFAWFQLTERLAASRHAVATQQQADAVLKLLLDAETGQRGYVITGDDAFLKPLVEASQQIPQHFGRLVELSHEDPGLLKEVNELQGQAEVSLKFHNQAVDLRRTQGFPEAAKLVATGEGKNVMDDIRTRVAHLRATRLDLSSSEARAVRSQLLRASLTSLVAGVLGIGAGLLAFWLARLMLQQQRRERALVEAKLAAERSSQEKSTFLANVSHEIRTPMNAILGFSELLQGETLEPRQRQFLKSIRTSSASMLQLLNDILDMSKVEAGVLELRPEPTDPREICDFVQTLFSEPVAKKGVRLECRVAEDLPRALLLDRIRMRQILINLVGNAMRFTDQGVIEVRIQWARQSPDSHIILMIDVQDTGVGIPPDKLASIFKPFVQAGAHYDKDHEGTGLGLAIVKRLTEAMGGTVTAASIPGQGSAFSLKFPNVPISARLPTSEKLISPASVDFNRLHPATVLVVDDNETNCQLIAGMFDGSHHRLIFGASGEEAVAKARELKPDAILLDIRMPGMDGREALNEIRKIAGLELTPIIAVTASSLLTEEMEFKRRFNGYVRKPFSRSELFDQLAQFLPMEPASAAPAASTGDQMPPASAGRISAPPELVRELQRLRAQTWPAIRDSMAVHDAKEFGRKLDQLGQQWHCQPLIQYAQTLIHHAELYAVADLEEHLHDFGNLVEQLDQPGNL